MKIRKAFFEKIEQVFLRKNMRIFFRKKFWGRGVEIIRNILILVLESSISQNMWKSFLRKYKNLFREKFWGWGRKVRLVPLYITTAYKVAFCSRFLQITYSTSSNLIINCKSRTLKSIVILFGTYSWTISFSVNNDVTSCVFSPRKRSHT